MSGRFLIFMLLNKLIVFLLIYRLCHANIMGGVYLCIRHERETPSLKVFLNLTVLT